MIRITIVVMIMIRMMIMTMPVSIIDNDDDNNNDDRFTHDRESNKFCSMLFKYLQPGDQELKIIAQPLYRDTVRSMYLLTPR